MLLVFPKTWGVGLGCAGKSLSGSITQSPVLGGVGLGCGDIEKNGGDGVHFEISENGRCR